MKKKIPENNPGLKKVKIDDHIRASKAGHGQTPPRKRGRPRKNPESFSVAGETYSGGNSSPGASVSDPLPSPPGATPLPAAQSFQPIYDTTEEAKGFLRTPFDLAAGLTSIPGLALYPAQLEAMAPSFKIVYDKHIKPHLGSNPEIWAFGVVASGVIMEKVAIFKETKERQHRQAEQAIKTNPSGYTPTPVNSNPVQTTQ